MGLFDQGRAQMQQIGYDDTCRYERDGVAVGEAVPCKVGQSQVALNDYGNVVVHAYQIDFLLPTSQLAIGCPDVRDIIEWQGRRYAVVATQGEPCWRWHDRSQTVWRVHTEEVGDEQIV